MVKLNIQSRTTDKDYAVFLEERDAQKVAKSLVMLAKRDMYTVDLVLLDLYL